MGTKNNPGKFDCYENAEPDEPMFILLARDERAPALVRLWAAISEGELAIASDEYNKLIQMSHRFYTIDEKLQEACDCASNMEQWKANK